MPMGATLQEASHDVRAVKKRLLAFRDIERDIDNQIERLENLTAKMYSVGSPEMSDMPKGSSVISDRIAANVARKMELEESIRGMIARRDAEQKWLGDILEHIRKPDERAVIQMRYVDSEDWNHVCRMLFGSKWDFNEKEESYLRRTTNLHGRALVSIAVYLEGRNAHGKPQKAAGGDEEEDTDK
jgi:hypothetical protein